MTKREWNKINKQLRQGIVSKGGAARVMTKEDRRKFRDKFGQTTTDGEKVINPEEYYKDD